MKTIKSYSLNEETIKRISSLSEALGISDSSILEILVRIGYMSINDNVIADILKENAEG